MAGYKGYSMSNNAVEAYNNEEKPLSKWTKDDILKNIEKAIQKDNLTLQCSIEKLKSAPVKVLKDLCLYHSSWHNTSNRYNKTYFYSMDYDNIALLTNELIKSKIELNKSTKTSKEEKWECAFLEWSGTLRYPKSIEIIEEGIVKGIWFYRKDGSKKKTTANGFRFIKKNKHVIYKRRKLWRKLQNLETSLNSQKMVRGRQILILNIC